MIESSNLATTHPKTSHTGVTNGSRYLHRMFGLAYHSPWDIRERVTGMPIRESDVHVQQLTGMESDNEIFVLDDLAAFDDRVVIGSG